MEVWNAPSITKATVTSWQVRDAKFFWGPDSGFLQEPDKLFTIEK